MRSAMAPVHAHPGQPPTWLARFDEKKGFCLELSCTYVVQGHVVVCRGIAGLRACSVGTSLHYTSLQT